MRAKKAQHRIGFNTLLDYFKMQSFDSLFLKLIIITSQMDIKWVQLAKMVQLAEELNVIITLPALKYLSFHVLRQFEMSIQQWHHMCEV